MRKFTFALSILFGSLPGLAQSATVEVVSTFDPIPEETPSIPIDLLNGSSLPRTGGSGGGGTGASASSKLEPAQCRHFQVRYQPGAGIGPKWENPHDGELLQSCSLTNRTSVTQSFSREVKATVKTTVDGSLTVNIASARVGIAVEVEVKDTFSIVVPRKSIISFNAYSRLMDRGLDVVKVCNLCNQVLAVESGTVHAAFGVNGRYE